MEYDTSELGEAESATIEHDSAGVSRRDALKRGAMVGGAVLWATPVVQNIGMSRAFGQTTTPVGTGISFIAFRFVCDGVERFAKVEDIVSATQFTCEGVNASPNCGISVEGAQNGCGFFTLSNLVFSNTGELLSVRVNLTCGSGAFLFASTKCGMAHGGCTPMVAAGSTATFNCA